MNVNEALDEKGLFAAAQTVDPSSIIGFTWQECLERAEAAIRAYLAATTGKAAGEAVTASWGDSGPIPGQHCGDEFDAAPQPAQGAEAVRVTNAVVSALMFYADTKNWVDTPSWDGDPSCFTPKAIPVVSDPDGGRPCDCGDIARAALSALAALDKPSRLVEGQRK
jgi:hypothetical protein